MKERTRSEVKGIIYTIYKVDGRGLDQGCQTYQFSLNVLPALMMRVNNNGKQNTINF